VIICFFVSGLPRSGSTLLCNILGQNSNHKVTPTNGLCELFMSVKNRWRDVVEFKSQGLDTVKPNVESALGGLLNGYYADDMSEGKICFDKSRGWLAFIEYLESALRRKVKILVTVRDVRAIVASFERIYRKRGIDYIEQGDFMKSQTIEGRGENLLSNGGVVGITISRFRDVINRGLRDRLYIIPYRELTIQPKIVMDQIHKWLEIDPFEYDFDNIEQITHEDDAIHGMGGDLHTVRTKVEPQSAPTWHGILPESYSEYLMNEYVDINGVSEFNEEPADVSGIGDDNASRGIADIPLEEYNERIGH